MLLDTSPMDVLNRPARFPHQMNRLNEGDDSYPVDMLIWHGRRWILDGAHRIAKAYSQGASGAKGARLNN